MQENDSAWVDVLLSWLGSLLRGLLVILLLGGFLFAMWRLLESDNSFLAVHPCLTAIVFLFLWFGLLFFPGDTVSSEEDENAWEPYIR